MGMIDKLLKIDSPGAEPVEASAWTDPLWWSGAGGQSVSGEAISPDTALKISTVYACVGLLSETIASLPLVMYRYIENEQGREKAKNHPLYTVLHDQPNESQTAFDFTQMVQAHALLRGSGYAEIKPGARGFVDQLVPRHPDQVEKERLHNNKIRYIVTDDDGRRRTLNQEDVFEVGGLSLDGWNTISVVSYARDSMGQSMATEKFGGRFFKNDTRPGGVLHTDSKLSPDAALRLKTGWETLHAAGNQHRVAVLEQGLRWQPVSVTPEESQFLESRAFNAEDICRWFRVPPHMVGLTSKATSWGSGIEQMSLGFLTYTLRPWLTRWSQAIRRDLILAPNTYFADFMVEHLLRGDVSTRFSAYATARQWGWMTVNEIRQRENLNPVDEGDVYLQPMNMTPAGEEPTVNQAALEHYRLLAQESASRLVRKEVAAMNRSAKSPDWAKTVTDFYYSHVNLVTQAMQIKSDLAQAYCEAGRDALITEGLPALADWEEKRVLALVELALSESE